MCWQQVVLEDLELRSDCLEGLGAPISLQGGYVGNLRIKIPWNSLTSKPVIIELEKIHLILHPQQSIARNSEANYAALSKQASIAAAELAKRANIKATTSWRSNILSRVLNRIISSIQLRILDVHVRFEVSKEQTSSTSFAVGAVIQEISSYTGSLSEKLFHMKGLAVYWDRDEKPTSCSEESVVQLAAKFSEWGINTDESSASSSVHEDEEGDIFFVARSEGETPVHQYLLHPFDLTFTLRVLASNLPESAEFEKPKYEADVRMRAVRLSLEVGQMWDILRLADWMQVCELRKSHSELRPAVKVSEDPVAWWRFAISAVSNQCRSTKWSWMDMKLLFTNRREYSRLYLLMLSGKASSQERLQLSSLEGQLPVEQIMFSRSIAEELLGKHQPSTGSRERGWFRWGLRWVMIPQGGSKGNGGDMELEFTREEEDFLSNALEIQDKEAGEQQAFLTDPVGLIDGGVMDTMPAAEERQGLASAEVETVGPTPSRKKKPRRLPNKFQGVGWERAHRLATEWFGTPRSSNASLAVADVVVDELTVTLAVRLPDDEIEDDACNFFNMQEIIKASLSNISIRVNAGTEETSLVSKIQQLSARDMLSQRSYFPCLISSKFTEILEDNCRNSETDRVKSGDVQSLPAVVCNVKVIGGTTEIHVLLQPLEIVLLPECLHALGAFFIPEYQAPFHENNIVEALNNIDDGPGRIQAKLSYLVQKMSHQVILDLRAEKPRLVIPGDVFRPDLTLIVGLDELNVGSSPYSWHGATAWAVAAAAKTLAGCANHKERQKQMQRMFFGSLSLKMKGVRLFLAESAPVANFSFMTYRLAHALRARMDSDGHSLSNPQFSKASADVLLPMDVDLSILLSLLRSDASMPLIFLGTHISRLAVEGSLHEITQALEVFEKMGQISLPSLERRQMIKEQARRANLGRPYCSSAAHKSGMLRRREALQQTPFIDTAIQITSPNPDRCAEKDAVHESATTNETQMLKEGVACKINNAEEDSHRSSADAVPGTESQDVTVASLTSEADMTLSQTSGRAEVDSTPKQQSAAQWRVLQWLNGGRKLSPSTCPPESNPVSRPEMPRPADAEQDGTTIPSAKQGPGQIGAVRSIQDIEKRTERSWLWRVAGGQSSGSVAVASEPGKIYTLDVSGVAEGMRGAQVEEVRGAHFVGASDQKLREAADMDRSWFRWRSTPRKHDPPPQVLPAGTSELSNANQVQNRTSGSLLKHLKFLYPASQAAEAPDSARDEESIARGKVMEFQLTTRSEAYRAVESGGLQWERLTWKEKLRACLQVDADSGGKARTAEFSDNADWRLRGQAVELPDDSGHHPDLPKLRERYSSSFIATDLDEMSRSDAIHVEAQVSVDSCSFAVLEHRSGQESFSHVSTPCAAFALQLLQCDTDPEPAGRRDASFSLLAVLQRHGLRLSSTVGDVLAFCGSKESVVAHAEDVCVLSSRDGETQIAVKSSGLVDSGPELRPMLHLSLSVFETGYTRLDGARVAVSATLRCLSTRIDVAMCQNLSRLHSQFLLRNKASQEAGSSKAPPINKMDLNDVISAKLMVDFGAVNVTVQDPLKKNNWNRVIGIGFRCAIDSGPDAEKLGELSLGYLGIDNSTDESKTWVRVLGPQDSWPLRPQPDTASNSAPPHPAQSHPPSEPLFSASLQRKADGADAASYRASCLALELQRAIRRAPNLIQDQKLNLRSQWQELKIDFRTQKRCAAGKDVISFLVDEWGAVDREEGLRLGQVLIDQGLMHKVPEPGSFEDSNSLFRFYADEEDVTAPSKVAEDGCRVVQAKSFVRKRFLLQVKLIALRMQASAPCFESISNTASALRALEPQQEQRQGQERGLAMKVGDDVKTKALAVLDNLDLDLCSAGFCCYFPAIVNGYELVASFSGLNVHSAFVSTDFSDMRNRECLREEVGEVRLGTAGEAGVRGVRTTGFESLAWTAGQSHSFCIRLSGCQAVDTKRQQADVVKCFDVEVGLCTRPCGIVTVDLAITPLHLELSDQFLNTIATAAAFIPVRLESSSEAQGGDVDSTAGHVLLVAKTFFSGGYGFKFDFGGLTVALPACPAEPHSFVFCVKPASAVCQILFRDCGLLPLDARDRPPVSARGARGPAVATGVAGLLVDNLGAFDLALIMDDVVLTVQERAVLCGRSTWSEAAGSAALVAEPGPGQGMQSLASGDEWRLLHLTASWRPGDAGCGLSLGLQAGRRQRLVGRGRGVGLRAALALALGARGQAACRAGSGAGLKVTDQQDQSQLSQHRIWCKVEEQSVWRRWTARRQRRSEHAEMGLLGASSARPSRRAAEQRRVELTCRAAAAVRHRSTPSLPDDARHLPRRGRGVW